MYGQIGNSYGQSGTGVGGGSYSNSFINSDLVTGKLTVNHNLDAKVIVSVYDNDGKQVIPDDIAVTANNAVIDLTSFGNITGNWSVVILASGGSGSGSGGSGVTSHADLTNRDAVGNHATFTPLVNSQTAFNFTRDDGTPVFTIDNDGFRKFKYSATTGSLSVSSYTASPFAQGINLLSSTGTLRGGFGFYSSLGDDNPLDYHFVGSAYNTPLAAFHETGEMTVGARYKHGVITAYTGNTGNVEMISLRGTYGAAPNNNKSIAWRDSTDAVAKIETSYDGTKINMNFGSLYNGTYSTSNSFQITGAGLLKVFRTNYETFVLDNNDIPNKKYVDDLASTKQNTLVSGTNIKTINGDSLIGSGDLIISGGSSAFPKMRISSDLGSTSRFSTASGNGGTNAVSSGGLSQATGSTAGGYVTARWNIGTTRNMFLNNPSLCYHVTIVSPGTTYDFYAGFGAVRSTATANNYATSHAGFKIVGTAGVSTLYATNGNGTNTTVSNAITTVAGGNTLELFIVVTTGSKVDYYYRKNEDSVVLGATINTNLPSSTLNYTAMSLTNLNTTNATQICISGVTYER